MGVDKVRHVVTNCGCKLFTNVTFICEPPDVDS